ncbi:MAG: hypothetical protein JO170_00890 [Verrucomicrobia bacterium]|nr:hypothetical protein [Verrucomicrobiota bacterium]
MHPILRRFGFVGSMALAVVAVSCSSMQTQVQSKEDLLVAAGFQVIVPKTSAQQQKLQTLPADRVTLVQFGGKTYYVFPDAPHNQAYVGGPAQFQSYLQLRLANKLANENLEAAEMNRDASLGWGGWGGWGGAGWVRLR